MISAAIQLRTKSIILLVFAGFSIVYISCRSLQIIPVLYVAAYYTRTNILISEVYTIGKEKKNLNFFKLWLYFVFPYSIQWDSFEGKFSVVLPVILSVGFLVDFDCFSVLFILLQQFATCNAGKVLANNRHAVLHLVSISLGIFTNAQPFFFFRFG